MRRWAGEQEESWVLIGRQCLNLLLLLLLNSRTSPVSRAATAGPRARETRGKPSQEVCLEERLIGKILASTISTKIPDLTLSTNFGFWSYQTAGFMLPNMWKRQDLRKRGSLVSGEYRDILGHRWAACESSQWRETVEVQLWRWDDPRLVKSKAVHVVHWFWL